jgi:hypothetical protein
MAGLGVMPLACAYILVFILPLPSDIVDFIFLFFIFGWPLRIAWLSDTERSVTGVPTPFAASLISLRSVFGAAIVAGGAGRVAGAVWAEAAPSVSRQRARERKEAFIQEFKRKTTTKSGFYWKRLAGVMAGAQ